jgi:hypothetical protein
MENLIVLLPYKEKERVLKWVGAAEKDFGKE